MFIFGSLNTPNRWYSYIFGPEGNIFAQEIDGWTFEQEDFDALQNDIGTEFIEFFATRVKDVDP